MRLELHQLGVHLLSHIVRYSTAVSQIIWGSYQAFLFMEISHVGARICVHMRANVLVCAHVSKRASGCAHAHAHLKCYL
jgi:hypothetical protein